MQPGDNVYRDAAIWIWELAGELGILATFLFPNCDSRGSAVLVPQGSSFVEANLGRGPGRPVVGDTPDRPEVIGAILALNLTFEGCTFMNVGFAGPSEFVQQIRQSLGSTG